MRLTMYRMSGVCSRTICSLSVRRESRRAFPSPRAAAFPSCLLPPISNRVSFCRRPCGTRSPARCACGCADKARAVPKRKRGSAESESRRGERSSGVAEASEVDRTKGRVFDRAQGEVAGDRGFRGLPPGNAAAPAERRRKRRRIRRLSGRIRGVTKPSPRPARSAESRRVRDRDRGRRVPSAGVGCPRRQLGIGLERPFFLIFSSRVVRFRPSSWAAWFLFQWVCSRAWRIRSSRSVGRPPLERESGLDPRRIGAAVAALAGPVSARGSGGQVLRGFDLPSPTGRRGAR